MRESYQIRDQGKGYFFTFQVVGWADVFSRKVYRDIVLQSFDYCRKEKDMILHAYVIMTNHVHAIIRSESDDLSGLIRDFKKFTSKQILNEVQHGLGESRKEWMEMILSIAQSSINAMLTINSGLMKIMRWNLARTLYLTLN